jgi:hypothetical protein
MKSPILLAGCLLAVHAAAQDVEPTPERAVRAIVQDLVSDLPWHVPNGEALAIEPAPTADPKVVESFTAALLRAGFTVRAGAAEGGVPVRVTTRPAGELVELRVTAGDFSSTRLYGRASWIDRPHAADKVLVVGWPSESISGAIESARTKLRLDLQRAYPALVGRPEIERAVLREPLARFIGKRTEGGRERYEAYVLADPGVDRLERAERSVHSRARTRVWLKGGSIAAAGFLLWVMYLRADFRSRGWRTNRLRFLFGTLFVAISATLLWNFPR